MNKRVTAFLGSGITAEIDGIMSNKMTEAVIGENSLLKMINERINEYYSERNGGCYACNFEDIFAALEILYSLKMSKNMGRRKSLTGAFADFNAEFKSINLEMIIEAETKLIEVVAQKIDDYNQLNENSRFFKEFWEKSINNVLWDIVTLNYDTCIEFSIGDENYEDGFECDESCECKNFRPLKLDKATKSRIMHIHGCILYGYKKIYSETDGEENSIDELRKLLHEHCDWNIHDDLYKYSSYCNAKETWFCRSNNETQSNDQAIIGPIITGLRKTDKIISYPYQNYYYEFQKAIYNNTSLLIAGYSFGDLHFNNLLLRMFELHGNERRIVIITRAERIEDWLKENVVNVVCRLLHEENPASIVLTDGFFESKDGCARLYLNGFKDAVENHGDDIIKFLGEDRSKKLGYVSQA